MQEGDEGADETTLSQHGKGHRTVRRFPDDPDVSVQDDPHPVAMGPLPDNGRSVRKHFLLDHVRIIDKRSPADRRRCRSGRIPGGEEDLRTRFRTLPGYQAFVQHPEGVEGQLHPAFLYGARDAHRPFPEFEPSLRPPKQRISGVGPVQRSDIGVHRGPLNEKYPSGRGGPGA